MRRPSTLCEKACVTEHSAVCRGLALVLAALIAVPPAALAAPAAKRRVVVLPYAPLPGVPQAAAERATELLTQELRGRDDLQLAELPKAAKAPSESALPSVRAALGKAAELTRKNRHAQAAESLQKAIALLTSNPALLDEEGGKLLGDAALQLAVELLMAGDEDGGDAALTQLVRLAPDREVKKSDYPPAFLVELSSMKRRLLAEPRGSLTVLAPPGAGEARVQLDGRPLRSPPVKALDLIPGEHFVRVERGGAVWGQKVIAIAGVETKVAPLPGSDGPAADVTSALLQGEIDRAAVMAAGRLARGAGAQAAVFGALVKHGDLSRVRTFLALKDDRLVSLVPLELDAELLGGVVLMVKVGDDVLAKLAAPAEEPALPLALGAEAPPAAAIVQGAPPPPAPPIALAPLVSPPPAPVAAAPPPAPVAVAPAPAAPAESEPVRRVAVPGAPVAAAPVAPPAPAAAPPQPRAVLEPPSRALVIPRQPSPEDEAPVSPTRSVQVAPAGTRMAALEPEAVKTVREPPPKKSHALLWIVAGALVAGGLAAGGYYLYEHGQVPTTATVTTTWGR